MDTQPHIIVCREDFDRLQRVIEQHGDGRIAAMAEALDLELARAQIVPRAQLPETVVAMNSTVVFVDEEIGARREVSLCYPEEVRSVSGALSVLSPIGSALLGLSVGQSIDWPIHDGGHRRLTIVAVSGAESRASAAAS